MIEQVNVPRGTAALFSKATLLERRRERERKVRLNVVPGIAPFFPSPLKGGMAQDIQKQKKRLSLSLSRWPFCSYKLLCFSRIVL